MRGNQEERSPVNGVCAGTGTISVRSVAAGRPERAESAVPLPWFSSYAAVVLKRPVRYPRSNRIVGMTKQVSRSAGDAEGVRDAGETVLGLADTSCQWDCRGFGVRRGMGFRDAVVTPVATSLQTRMGLGVGVPPWKGIPGRRCCPVATSLMFSPWVRGYAVGLVFRVKRTCTSMSWVYLLRERRSITPAHQQFPRGRPFEELGSTLCGQSNMGGRSESYARSYASDPGSRDGTLQVSRAGNAGKSLTTPISIRSRQSLRQGVFGEIWHRQPNHLPVSSPDEATKKPQWCGNEAPPRFTPAPAPATAATAQG